MYRAAIVDDRAEDSGFVEKILNKWANERNISVKTQLFPSAESFLFQFAEEKDYDILLLDIEMPGMDGVTMAKQIRKINETVQIIFISGYSDYISEGYEVSALHYLLKPVREEKLMEVLDRALNKIEKNEGYLELKSSGELLRIPYHEIKYIDVYQNYVTVHGKEEYSIKRSLSDIFKELDERFYRAGRSLAVNLDYVRRVSKTEIRLSDGAALPLPRGAYEGINRAIIERD